MKTSLNNELIEAIKKYLMEEISMVDLLMEKLSIGKEAAYRRLRGEVPFTFYEAVLLANAMGLSLDQITGMSFSQEAMFSINLDNVDSSEDYLYTVFHRYLEMFRFITEDANAEMFIAANTLPFSCYLSYEHIIKFQYCRWMHQNGRLNRNASMSDIEFSTDLKHVLANLSELNRRIPTTHLILDTRIFSDLTQIIHYYVDLGIVSKNDINNLKSELDDFLKSLEDIAQKGSFANGNKVDVYLANMPLETSYWYIEKPDFRISFMSFCVIDYIASKNSLVCKMHKEWIQSLKRYATLISQCGEIQRNSFFKTQRELIHSM